MRKWILFILLFVAKFAIASEFIVVGQVYDSKSKFPLAGVSVYNGKTMQGAETDEEGFFYIKCNQDVRHLIFSFVGYKAQKIKIKAKQNHAIRVELVENDFWLKELSVIPGFNPARSIIAKVVERRKQNDCSTRITTEGKSEELMWIENRQTRSKTFEELIKLSKDTTDSQLPLLKKTSLFLSKNAKPEIYKIEQQTTIDNLDKLYEKLVGTVPFTLNFYESTVKLFGKSFVSPFSPSGNLFYRYILKDSVEMNGRMVYKILFRSLNEANLAFNGYCQVDGESYALKQIHLELPLLSNLNFVKRINLDFEYAIEPSGQWVPKEEFWDLTVSARLFEFDTDDNYSFRIVKQNTFATTKEIQKDTRKSFAGTDYLVEDLNQRIASIKGTPIIQTAAWIADAYLTSYMKTKYFDVGRIYQLARYTDLEGLRLNLPLKTNENLFRNFSLGGYLGYGFKSKVWNYQGELKYKIPVKRPTITSLKYTDDSRRLDYTHSDYFQKENPNYSGDADLFNTLLQWKSEPRMYKFKSVETMISRDWSRNLEMRLYYRNETLFNSANFVLQHMEERFESLNHQKISLVTRLSFNERNYEDHLNKVYMHNWSPVIYANLEAGNYSFAGYQGNYGKITITATQKILFALGQWDYFVEGSYTLGSTPWPLKYRPSIGKYDIFGRYRFSLMDSFEYMADHSIYVNSEWIFNGVILNKIPIVNRWKLREILTLKFLYGGINSPQLMDLPGEFRLTGKPYAELNAGVTNVFRILSVQGIWRLTQNDLEGVKSSRFSVSLRLSF